MMKTFDAAIYYLVEKDDENAFDILLDEFLEHATGNELRKACLVLAELGYDYYLMKVVKVAKFRKVDVDNLMIEIEEIQKNAPRT